MANDRVRGCESMNTAETRIVPEVRPQWMGGRKTPSEASGLSPPPESHPPVLDPRMPLAARVPFFFLLGGLFLTTSPSGVETGPPPRLQREKNWRGEPNGIWILERCIAMKIETLFRVSAGSPLRYEVLQKNAIIVHVIIESDGNPVTHFAAGGERPPPPPPPGLLPSMEGRECPDFFYSAFFKDFGCWCHPLFAEGCKESPPPPLVSLSQMPTAVPRASPPLLPPRMIPGPPSPPLCRDPRAPRVPPSGFAPHLNPLCPTVRGASAPLSLWSLCGGAYTECVSVLGKPDITKVQTKGKRNKMRMMGSRESFPLRSGAVIRCVCFSR